MTTIADILSTSEPKLNSTTHYITFKNADDCSVHIPLSLFVVKSLEGISDEIILSELNKQLKKRINPGENEYGPLLKPGSSFFLEPCVRPRRISDRLLQRSFQSQNIVKETQIVEDVDKSTTDIGLELDEKVIDLTELVKIAKLFMNIRSEMNLSQSDVARSLAKLYGIERSVSVISRFERMDLSLSNYLKLYPVLVKWINYSQTVEGRNDIVRAAASTEPNDQDKVEISSFVSFIGSSFGKRRHRTYLSSEITSKLEKYFRSNPSCLPKEMQNLATEIGLSPRTVRIWFYNRRARARSAYRRKMRAKKR